MMRSYTVITKRERQTPDLREVWRNGLTSKRIKAIIIAVVLLILLLLCFLIPRLGGRSPSSESAVDRTPQGNFTIGGKRQASEEAEVPAEVPTITFSGYGKYTVSADRPEVEFSNPAVNFVSMQFTLIDDATGGVVARTGLVPPDNYIYVNVMDYYKDKTGEFEMTIQIDTFTDDGQQMNGMTEKMTLIIE